MNEESKAILKLLCNLSPLPIDVISNYYSININSLSKTMVTLIDMSLIQITESGYYKIADPISESAYSYYGTIGKDDHYRLCNIINDSITNSNPQERNYDLWRVMFKAARLSGYNEMIDETLELNSDIISVIQKHYFENNYEEAYRLAKLIIEARPDSGSAYWFLIRSLIHLEKYGLASEAITQFQQFAPQRDILFLRGFLERKRNNIDKAIEFFDDAKRHGKHGVALFREMGLCHLLNGDLDNSIRYLNLAIGLQPDNSYVIDLIALVATYMKNEHEARRALEKLRIIDQGKYFHRLSRVEFAFGNIKAAREAASRAVKYKKTIPFEAKAQLILCEIAVGNIDEASNLIADLEKKHGNIRKDIQIGLLCRLKIAKNEFEDALINIERMSDHNSKHYKIIKRDILKSIVESGLFDSKELLSYQQRADELESQIDQYYEEHYLTNYDIYL
ncbi:MAG: hypothetical protein OEM52_02790 [bacterium]|nr:hypothetical protein [bacterium]